MDAITWAQLGVLATIFGGAVTVWKIRAADRRHYDDKIDSQAQALADFKLHVATLHPTSKEMYELRNDLTNAINQLTDRIDRWLEKK